jgi:hypothetical protein
VRRRARRRIGAIGVAVALALAAPVARSEDASVPAAAESEHDPSATGSGYVAGLFYSGHPTRTDGLEVQARADVTEGLRWSAHLAYTGDFFLHSVPDSKDDAYHDLLAGGWLAPDAELPFWLRVEGHLDLGDATGGAGFGGAGLRLGAFTLEAGGGAGVLRSLADTWGWTLSGRAAWRPCDFAELAALGLATRALGRDEVRSSGRIQGAGGGELSLGPFSVVRLSLRALAGTWLLALDRQGEAFDQLPDTNHVSLSALATIELAPAVHVYGGAGYRWAEVPAGESYRLLSVFVGFELDF